MYFPHSASDCWRDAIGQTNLEAATPSDDGGSVPNYEGRVHPRFEGRIEGYAYDSQKLFREAVKYVRKLFLQRVASIGDINILRVIARSVSNGVIVEGQVNAEVQLMSEEYRRTGNYGVVLNVRNAEFIEPKVFSSSSETYELSEEGVREAMRVDRFFDDTQYEKFPPNRRAQDPMGYALIRG